MNFKKTSLVFCLIICVLFSVSSVVAGDVNVEVIASESQDSDVVSQATVEVDNDNQKIENNLISSSSEDILSEKDNGTFTALQDKISNAAEGATIALENDYANDGVLADGILISKSITINGNGYTIDAQHKSRIFNVTANNVVLNDIKFINGNATLGGAIFCEGDNVTIWNSTFINNTADWGGANYINKFAKNVIISGDYIENSAAEGAAIFFDRKMENVTTLINLMDNKGKSTIYMAYRIDSTLTVEDMEFDYNTTGSTEISFTDATGIEATVVKQPDAVVNVNNNTITVSGFEPGIYTLSVKTVTDEEHDSVTKEAKITVNKIKTQLSASAITTTYNVNKNLVVTLKDANGNPLSGVDVIVNLNGAKTYTTVDNGQIKVPTKGLAPKVYTAKITFNGTAKYDQATKSVKVTVKKATPKLTAKAKTFKQSVKTKKYSVTLKTNLNKAIKNAKVTLKVNKKTYTAITNKKGVAIFKITKLTKKGTFKATITYKGNAYYNKVTKKVNIKCR